jgi:predicted metal-dependent hydrolase
VPDDALSRGLTALAAERWFEAHEHLEEAWRALPEGDERRFVHGLIHVAVALYQAERGNPRGARSQRAKAERKLRGRLRGVDAGALLDDLEVRLRAAGVFESGV